ncbi:MAG: DNA-directed RNA polymerase subunit alpha C-terminal domain-containing protein [Pirellulaceae bacterium]
MMHGLETELKDIVLSNTSFGPEEIKIVINRVSDDYSQFTQLKELTSELARQESRTPATSVRLGVCQYLLGNYSAAVETLSNADGGALSQFYMGKANLSLGHHDQAVACFEAAKTAGYDSDLSLLAVAETHRNASKIPNAMTILDNMFGPVEQTAEYLYQRGATIAARGDNPDEVVALYERAVEADGKHTGALFGLGLENDRRGNDEKALELYQRAAAVFPTNVGVLVNLGLMYEDYDRYEMAQQCYDRILEHEPNNSQALLYRKDAAASMDPFFDYEQKRRQEQLKTIMNIPVSQFELSVRSRNCLEKMGIETLGDLTKVSELELLGSKNFGETSLVEIREMLANKGLAIGQYVHEKETTEEPMDLSHLSHEEQVLMERPIADLNLSVRARKCMTRLGLTTIGELIRKSADDLLECKNFGVTSLNEIREKLTQFTLTLRGE